MTEKSQPLIVQFTPFVRLNDYGKEYSTLYGLSNTGEVYRFNFGDKVMATEIEPHEEYHDDGFKRHHFNSHRQEHVGWKNRGWEKVENFVNELPKGYEIR
jgi:hypothetical protein